MQGNLMSRRNFVGAAAATAATVAAFSLTGCGSNGSSDAKKDEAETKEANVEDNSWTIWAYEHMYTAADPDEATKAFIEYMMSDDVQGELVEAQGYIPVSGMKVEKDASGKVTKK